MAGPAPRSLLADRAYGEIRDRIISLSLLPGQAIGEDELIEQLGIGRTPIREAIRRLAHESLIEVYPRRGTFVSDIQITDLAAISEVREHLEGCAAGLAAARYRVPEDAAALQRLRASLEAINTEPAGPSMDLDAEIHRFVYRLSRNPYLEDTLTRYYNLSHRIWNLALSRLGDVKWSIAEHQELLEAIESHDAGRAQRCASLHVARFEREIRTVL